MADRVSGGRWVPKAVDVIAPAGTAQSDELDYTIHDPVVIQPVTIP